MPPRTPRTDLPVVHFAGSSQPLTPVRTVAIVLLLSAAGVVAPAAAQPDIAADTARDSITTRRRNLGFELGVGVTTRAVPDFGDGTGSFGPIVSLMAREPALPGLDGVILGVSAARTSRTNRYPGGTVVSRVHEGVSFALGMEWKVGENTRFDLQWNPAVSRVRYGGTEPAPEGDPSGGVRLRASSLGIRFGSERSRLNFVLRAHALLSISPTLIVSTAVPSLQVVVRPWR